MSTVATPATGTKKIPHQPPLLDARGRRPRPPRRRDALKAYLEVVCQPVFVDPALPPTARDTERARLRTERLAQLPDQVFGRRGFGAPRRDVYLPRAEVLAADEWLTAHSRPVASTTPADAKAVLNAYRLELDGNPSASTTRDRLRNVLHEAPQS